MRSTLLKCGAGLVAAVAIYACGSGSPSAPTPPSTANAIVITINGQNGAASFSPNPAVAGGQIVVFRNNDSMVHRVALNDGGIDTGDIPPGAMSGAVMMPAAGTNYHCMLHTTMVGSVSAASGTAPPPCQGVYC